MASFPPGDHSPTFVWGIIKNFKICARNHQKFVCGIIKITFLINVACRSDANMIKWPCAAVFSPISSCRRGFEIILWHIYHVIYVMWQWDVHKRQLAQPSQCCIESAKYCRRLQPTTKNVLAPVEGHATWSESAPKHYTLPFACFDDVISIYHYEIWHVW